MGKQNWKMHFYKGKPCIWEHDKYDEERENYIFEVDLYIGGYMRGCSSAVMLLVPYKDRNKDYLSLTTKYQVFMSDIEDIIKEMIKGRIKASFTWVKKGSNYGLKLVK